jgi:hypothetical protein
MTGAGHPVANAIHRRAQATSGTGLQRRAKTDPLGGGIEIHTSA